MKNYFVIGVMSGTSIDGVDIVYMNFFYEESWKFKILNSKTYVYNNEWQVALSRIVKNNIESVKQIDQNYTRLHYSKKILVSVGSEILTPTHYNVLFSSLLCLTVDD